ncbi:MAG: hypothetical protein E7499_03535 [Ruminococcus sp.]|nr:hypothetical protein [Ruminococcus sp.]
MNTNNITTNSPLVSVRSAEVHANEGQTKNVDFMSVISQIISQNGESQVTDALKLFANEEEADSEVIDELLALLAQYNSSLKGDGGLFALTQDSSEEDADNGLISSNLTINDLFGGTDVASTVIEVLLNGGNDNDVIDALQQSTDSVPIKVLYEMAKVNLGKSELELPDEYADFDFEEKVLKINEILLGKELTVENETDIEEVARQLKSDYELSAAISESAKKAAQKENASSETMVIDYNKDYRVDLSTLRGMPVTEESLVTGQVIKGIDEAFKNELTRLTVRLNPEGLGEVIVRLKKTDVGMIVSLSAQNMRTAEMLNSQLNAIQANLTKYDAQVNPVTIEETQLTASYNFNQQMFGNQPQKQGKNNSDDGYFRGNDDYDAEAEIIPRKITDGALNIYA